MATYSWWLKPKATSDAVLRTQLTTFRDILVTCGLVQTSDTGQIDLATVTRPGGVGEIGIFIFRFNDALQSTAPVFLRVRCYQFSATGCWGFTILVGTGTDGAGVLANSSGQIDHYAWGSNNGNATIPTHRFSGDGSRLQIFTLTPYYTAQNSCYLSIERTKSLVGADTGEGLIVYFKDGPTSYSTSLDGDSIGSFNNAANFVWKRAANPPTTTMRGCLMPATGLIGVAGTNEVYTYPLRGFNQIEYAPSMCVLGYFDRHLKSQVPIKITLYDGLQHTFFPCGYSGENTPYNETLGFAAADNTTADGTALLIRWE